MTEPIRSSVPVAVAGAPVEEESKLRKSIRRFDAVFIMLSALITLDTVSKKLSYTVTFDGLTGPAAAAHFHGPADKSAVAGVAVPIGGANPVSPVVGSATLTDAQIKDLTSGKWYVNVHTAANKPGEIRGQVMKSKD